MRAHELMFETPQPRDVFRSQIKTWQDLEQALPRIQTAIERFQKGFLIYRGLKYTADSVLFKPEMPKGTRSSANTSNYYTLFTDNNVRWKDYPPRSASVIGSNNYSIAENYGHPYVLLPEGDPIIGIASENDFWFSFPRLYDIGLDSLDELNYEISNIMKYWLDKPKYRPTSWQEFKKDLQQIDQINYLSFPNLPKKESELYITRNHLLKFQPGTTMEEKLDYLLDPQANGIELTRLSSFKYEKRSSHEVWFNSPCWLIQYDLMQDNLSNSFNLVSWIKQKAAQEQR